MKRNLIAFSLLVFWVSGYNANWIDIHSQQPKPANVQLISSDIAHSSVHFTLDGFSMSEVQTPMGTAYTVSVGNTTPILAAGAPDLPKFSVSLVIPDQARMNFRIVSSLYKDYENIEIAPSKGVLFRDTDPSKVPFQYGKAYRINQFYPADLADTRDPHIIRDLRGQTLLVYPFQYNPVTKTLRVYYDITVELCKAGDDGINPLVRKTRDIRINKSFASVYSHEFLNFDELEYAPLGDYGNILVISYGQYMTAIQPYVDWKNSIGYPTKLVNVSDIGTTAASIKTYIANYYNTYGLTFVLLVGDGPQIPTNTGGGLGGPSDNAYGYIAGNDHYADLFVGRFSAENAAQVQTQVQRTIDYERNPQYLTDGWFTTVLGIGSDQGPGDNGEYDYQHIRVQQSLLLNYTYTWNPELFDGSQGGNDAAGNPNPASVSTEVNAGTGLILYCGHGSQTSWGTTGFSNGNVNQLVNQGKLPFIWSVACVNGDFANGTCFAEAWLRATQGGQPTGAVAFLGSTINQSWNSPMAGQDAMTQILAEYYPTNIKRTFGGTSINGCMKMIDSYGNDGANMADTWTIFGDPSLTVRTDNPDTLLVTHDAQLLVGSTTLNVTCNVNGARATASLHDTILATALIANNMATLSFPPLQTANDSVHLAVTAYNFLPDESDIPVIAPNGPYVIYINNHMNDTTGNNNDLVDYGENMLMTIYVKNVGIAPTSDMTVKVRTTDQYVTMTDTTENYGAVAPGAVKKVQDAYAFHVSNHVPDGHVISYDVLCMDGAQTWSSAFTAPAHAPEMILDSYILHDSTGNNNGRLDPGETDHLVITVKNSGSSEAFNATGHLVSFNPYITVIQDQIVYGDINGGNSTCRTFTVHADSLAPEGQSAPFMLEITADNEISGSGSFNLVVGKIPVLIVDYDGNSNSGPAMKSAVESLNLTANYTAASVPDSLDRYSSVFVCLGVYPQGHALSANDGQKLAAYLNYGGRLYMEGGDTWFYDPQTAVHQMFNIFPNADGSADLGTLLGYAGTFTEGMSFLYSGDNNSIDHITSLTTAFHVFKNQSPLYDNVIANDAGAYKTIGSSFEFGGLTDGSYPSTKIHLMEEYLNFFGIQPPPLKASFIGFPTEISPGEVVSFSDYSTGGVTSWNWSFPGGTPSTSTEKNPVITYNIYGTHDVTLIVNNGFTNDTMLKPGYIHVDYATAVGEQGKDLKCLVSPDPTTGIFNATLSTGKEDLVSLTLFDSFGSVVMEEKNLPVSGKLIRTYDLSGRPNGVYFLKINGQASSLTKKIVLQK
jgi:PKD repeat protein